MFGPHADTFHKAERLRKADPVRNKDLRAEGEVKFSLAVLFEQTILRPFKMLVQEPILVLVTIYLSMVYAVLYARRSRGPYLRCPRSVTHHNFVKYSRRFPSSSSIVMDLQLAKTGFSFSALALGHQPVPYSIVWCKRIGTRF
jgi:hypothetical protein